MMLSKNFLHKEPDFIQISRFKIVVGILIGLFFSFAFYSFLYLIREVFRILSVTTTYDLWILTDKEVNFYNLIFAFISVIIAQSITLIFWFDRPRRISEYRNYKKISIINDQRALNWYFLSWFSKLAIVFGLFYGFTLHRSWYVFSLYPKYNYMFVLIIIVLFMQTWSTIRLTFIRNSLKWMFSSFILVSTLSFGLSKINLIDYKAINESILSKNIYSQYKLILPLSDIYQRAERPFLVEHIYVVCSKDDSLNLNPIIIVDNQEISLDSLHIKIRDWQSMRDEIEIPFVVYCLHIHKSIKMRFVSQLKNEMAKSGARKIAYAVIPMNHEYDKRYYQNYSFSMVLPYYYSDWFCLKEILNDLNGIQNIIEIQQIESNYFINDSLIDANQLKSTIKRRIQQNLDYVIKFYVNDSIEFTDYFKVLLSIKEAIYDLKNEYSENKYSKQYDLLNYDEENDVNQKFPFRTIEITTELKKIIDYE
jgi:hypothetical protein